MYAVNRVVHVSILGRAWSVHHFEYASIVEIECYVCSKQGSAHDDSGTSLEYTSPCRQFDHQDITLCMQQPE